MKKLRCWLFGHDWQLTAGALRINWGTYRCGRCPARAEGRIW